MIVETGFLELCLHIIEEDRPGEHFFTILHLCLVAENIIHILKDPHLGSTLTNHPYKLVEELTPLIIQTFELPCKRPRLAAHTCYKEVNHPPIPCSIQLLYIIPPILHIIISQIGLLCRLVDITREDNLVLNPKLVKCHFRGANARECSSYPDSSFRMTEHPVFPGLTILVNPSVAVNHSQFC